MSGVYYSGKPYNISYVLNGATGPQGSGSGGSGPQGVTGPQGFTGPQGPVGTVDGVTGSTPYYINGSWTWSNTNIYNNGTRVGIGGTGSTASSDLHVFGSLSLDLATTSSVNYTLTENNFTLLVYAPNGGSTVSLPAASSARHRIYVIKKVDSSTSSIVNVRPNAGDNIEGWTGNITLDYPYDYYMLQSTGGNMWIKLGGAGGLNL
jgi:hypothetical protein